jgi:putative PEP-CTERM system TPR-repeat lipoprotein
MSRGLVGSDFCLRARSVALLIFCAATMLSLSGCDYFRSVPDRIARAEQLVSQSQYRAAAIELKNVIEKEPNNPQARLLLAEILVFMAEPMAAQRDLEIARQHGGDAARANDIDIRALLLMGRYEDVLKKFDDGFAIAEPRRSLYIARAQLGLQRYPAAMEGFLRVQAEATDDDVKLDATLGAIETKAALGDMDSALAELAKVLSDDPNAARAWSLQGGLQSRIGQLDAAIESLTQAHKLADRRLTVKQQADVLGLLIELQLGKRNLSGADQALVDLNKILPGALMTRLLQARVLVAKQDLPNAAAELQRIVRAAPDVAPAQFLLGMVLLQQNNINQAEQHLARAVALAPQHLEARKLLAQAQLRLDRPQAAIQSLMPALDEPGVDLQVQGLLGLAERQAGLESASVAYLEQALEQDPRNARRQLDLAAAYVRTGKFDSAVTLLRAIDDPQLEAQRAALLGAAVARTQGVASARAELEARLARAPRNMALLNVVADFYGQTGQPQRGVELLDAALAKEPKQVSLLIGRARLLVARGDAAGAERDLQAALKQTPDDRSVMMALADLNYRRGDMTSALDWLERLSAAEPGNIQVELFKARVLLSAKQAESSQRATDLLTRLVQAHPERSDVRSAVARLYVSAGRYEEALAQLRAAASLAKDDAGIQLEIARTQVALSQFEDARTTVAAILQRDADWLPAVALAAWLDLERRANDAAIARMAALRKRLPDDAAVAAAQAEILLAAGQPAAAVEAFEAALKRQASAALAIKATSARGAAKMPDPSAPLRNYVERNPHDAAARGALAQVYQQYGEGRRAIAQYERLRTDGISSAVMLNNLAWLYSEAGDARALDTARQAAALAPKNPAIADTLGWILLQQGQYAEALPILRGAAAGAPRDPEIRFHFALALSKSGDRDEARRVVGEALQLPGAFPSRSEAERLQAELSNGTTAPAHSG